MHPVQCECGATQDVPATMAGSSVACACGREIRVPSLSALKASAGQSAMSAEVRIEELLRRGELPRETYCLVCKRATKDVSHCWTTCERVEVQPTGWFLNPATWLTMFFGIFIFKRVTRETTKGRDVTLRVPVRICTGCAQVLKAQDRLREVMRTVPLYADLFAKYPDASVSLDHGLAGVTRREETF
jgi:hypothetical protein